MTQTDTLNVLQQTYYIVVSCGYKQHTIHVPCFIEVFNYKKYIAILYFNIAYLFLCFIKKVEAVCYNLPQEDIVRQKSY